MKLPQITPKQLIYKNIYGYDRLYSKLILSDTDWMNYILKAIFTVRKHGRFYVTFEFFGAQSSVMKVRQKKKNHIYKYDYEFSTDIFQETPLMRIRFKKSSLCQKIILFMNLDFPPILICIETMLFSIFFLQ